jgi:hypothetical protein
MGLSHAVFLAGGTNTAQRPPRRSTLAAAKKEPRETVAYWRHEAERNRPAADAIIALGAGTAPLEYLAALGCAQYVALHGVNRSGDGGRMGTGHPAAQALVRAEQRHLTQRHRMLIAKLDTIVGESADEPLGGHETLLEADRADTPCRQPKSRYQVWGDDKGGVDLDHLPGDA